MFRYTPLNSRPSLSVDPRQKYLAALAEVKAAEAEYLAAESTQREEQALRRRLEEIQLQKQFQGHSLRHSAYGQGGFISPFDSDIYGDRHAYGYDRLASLRCQIEEEERLRHQAEEREHLRRQMEEKRLNHDIAFRQAELGRESRRRKQEEQARLLLTLEKEKHAALLREHLAQAKQESARQEPHHVVCKRTPCVDGRHSRQAGEVALHPILQAILGKEVNVRPGPPHLKPSCERLVETAFPAPLEQFFGGNRPEATQASLRHQDVENFEKLLELVLGWATQSGAPVAKAESLAAPVTCYPEARSVQQVIELLLGGDQKQPLDRSTSSSKAQAVQPSSSQPTPRGPTSTSKAQADQSSPPQSVPHAHREAFQPFLDLFAGGHQQQTSPESSSKAQAAQPLSSQAAPPIHYPHSEGLQQLLDLFLGGQQQQPPQASSSSSKPQPTAAARPEFRGFEQFMNALLGKEQQAKPSTSATLEEPKSTTSVESSLKAELESRLGNEYASEVRDTIQAILASLSDSSSVPPSTSVPAPSSPSGSGKGKEKASAPARTSENATSKDVTQSLNEVHNIEAAFSALEAEFNFPSQLDFLTSQLTPDSHTSDSEASATSHLAYTSRNHPVRFYEQALGSLLSQLDSVDSFGNDDLRVKRKQVVDRVEKALEELESEVEGRWKTKVAKELKSFKVAVTDAVATPSEAPTETTNSTVPQTTVPDATTEDVPSKTEEEAESPAATVQEITSSRALVPAPEDVIPEAPAPTMDASSTQEESSVPVDTSSTYAIPADEPSAAWQAADEASTSGDITNTDTNDTDTSSTASLVESVATVRPADVAAAAVEPEPLNTFLLPAYPPVESSKPKQLPGPDHDVDAGSDWSEIEA